MSSSKPTATLPFCGAVETTLNALNYINAACRGDIPRVTRRLTDAERRTLIKSGAVFVYSVQESGIKRWTDGLLWSTPRIVDGFLVYREINERTSSRGCEQGTFKPDGLTKKTIVVIIEGSELHLISYDASSDQDPGKLEVPTARAEITSLPMDPPEAEAALDGTSRRVSDSEETTFDVECESEDGTCVHVSPTSWDSSSSECESEDGTCSVPVSPTLWDSGSSDGSPHALSSDRMSSSEECSDADECESS